MNLLIRFEKLQKSKLDFRVRLVLQYVSSNLQSDLSLERLAAVANVSAGHVCRLFRDELDLPPARCIKLLRMRSAAELLATTPLTVKQVMASVGFNDESHFVRDFERALGESPARYRARINEERPFNTPVRFGQ